MKNDTSRTNQPQQAKGGQRQNTPSALGKQPRQLNQKPQSEAETESETEIDSDLHDLFLDELADMLHAERQITKALPKLIKAAEAEELRTALQDHLAETQQQINRIEQVFASLGEKVEAKPCKGMQGILEEGDEMVKEMKDTTALDAAIISGGQKVEHYEIASYGTLVAWAEKMGHDEAARLLGESLAEEKAADEKLTEIAESSANDKAD
jgi:ferritin-like metal-binding protein YciE